MQQPIIHNGARSSGGRGRRAKDPTELSAAEWVRQQLVDEILSGRLRPGEKLSEVKLAERLGCSRTPVREAFRHLGALGLVLVEKTRGVTVVRLARRDMLDLYDAMTELESACAGLAACRLPSQARCELQALPAAAAAHAGTGEEVDLHAVLHRAAGNPILAEMARAVRHRLLPYWRLVNAGAVDWPCLGAAAQAQVIAAVSAGDGPGARQAMRAYVQAARAIAERAVPLG